jgi:hypothetical protein
MKLRGFVFLNTHPGHNISAPVGNYRYVMIWRNSQQQSSDARTPATTPEFENPT